VVYPENAEKRLIRHRASLCTSRVYSQAL
jgi:hypothetical protein